MDMTHIAEKIIAAQDFEQRYVRSLSRERAYANGQPGSAGGPEYTHEDDIRVINGVLTGATLPVFAVFDLDAITEDLNKVGLVVEYNESFPFQASVSDPEILNKWHSHVYTIFFTREGEFRAGHSGSVGRVHVSAVETPDLSATQLRNNFSSQARAAQKKTAAHRKQDFENRTKRRQKLAAERGQEVKGVWENWSHMTYPEIYENQKATANA